MSRQIIEPAERMALIYEKCGMPLTVFFEVWNINRGRAGQRFVSLSHAMRARNTGPPSK